MGTRSLDVQLVGRTIFRVDGEPVEAWPRPSARRLATLLVVAPGHRRSRDALADILWPHLPPERAARSVSKALSMARSALGKDILDADTTNIWIADEVEVTTDLEDVEALSSGRMPLADDPYEDWAIEVRDDLWHRHLDRLVEHARSSGKREDWEAVAAADPSNERAFLSAAAAAADDGDRDGIIAVFERHQRTLRELDLDVRPELRRSLDELLERANAGHASRARHAGQRTSDPVAPLTAPSLHGRDHMIATIVANLVGDDAGDGEADRRGTQMLIGGAGIGKSSVVLAVGAELQRRGWRLGHGAASPDDHLAPLAALRAALRGLASDTSDPLSRLLAAESRSADDVGASDLPQLADEIDAWLGRSPHPTVLVIDDLHWADRALQRLVVRLACRPDRTWALLLAARSDEPGHPIPDLPSGVPHLQLRPLDDEAAEAVVRSTFSNATDADVRRLVERGAGNPFFLLELARELDEHHDQSGSTARAMASGAPPRQAADLVPARVISLLQRRLEPVSANARRLLEHLAILGVDASVEMLRYVGVRLGAGGEFLDELTNAWLIRETGDRIELAHPLLRDAVLAETNIVRRATLHSRVAGTMELLAARRDHGRDHHTLAAAAHRVEAFRLGGAGLEEPLSTTRTAFEAGRLASRLFASEVAEELYEGGLSAFEHLDGATRSTLAGDVCRVWRELGHIRLSQGESASASAAYESALGLSPTPMARAKCWRALAWIPYRAGDMAGVIAVCRDGLQALGNEEGLPSALLRVELGWALHRSGDSDGAIRILEAASQVAEESGDWRLAARALDRFGTALDEADRTSEALETLTRAAQAADRAGSDRVRAAIALHTASCLNRLGRPDEALQQVALGSELSEQIGNVYLRSVAHWVSAEVWHASGDVAGALAEREAEIELLAGVDNDLNVAGAHAHRSVLLAELGRDAEAAEAATAAIGAARRTGSPRALADIEERVGAVTSR